jgi:hypothetical protein
MGDIQSTGTAGGVRTMLRFEGLMLFTAALFLYAHTGASWVLFFALFLVPDLSFIAYVFGPRVGALGYNMMHTTVGPIALAFASQLHLPTAVPLLPIALIWFAHVGFDRALGYGLKYTSDFSDTHLGFIGKKRTQHA